MNTVKLHWIETQMNDPFTSDTYAIEGYGFNTTEFSYVHEAIEFTLPKGYELSETVSGELAIYDEIGNHCWLDRHNKCPRLSSSTRVVYLKEAVAV